MKSYGGAKVCMSILILLLVAALLAGCADRGTQDYSMVSGKMVGSSDMTVPQAPTAAPSLADPVQSAPATTEEDRKANNLVGVWEGTTRASCRAPMPFPDRCNALQEVTMTLLRNPNGKLSGHYRCAYGNMNCFHMNESGKIVDASLNGPQVTMRVMMPDGTSCLFTGRTSESNDVNGGYTCYSGGARLEQGSWRAKRSY